MRARWLGGRRGLDLEVRHAKKGQAAVVISSSLAAGPLRRWHIAGCRRPDGHHVHRRAAHARRPGHRGAARGCRCRGRTGRRLEDHSSALARDGTLPEASRMARPAGLGITTCQIAARLPELLFLFALLFRRGSDWHTHFILKILNARRYFLTHALFRWRKIPYY